MSRKRNQLFSIPTYDAVFKWLLDKDTIRPSFLHAFIPGLNIRSSERIDEHMQPLKELELLRDLFHSKETGDSVNSLQDLEFAVHIKQKDGTLLNENATTFLRNIVQQFDDLKLAFPKVIYNGAMDFVCRLDTGENVLVEMQIIPYDYWDQRALAYVAAVYGKQLRRGGNWKDIKRIIGINILGGGKDQVTHWKETPDQFVRHYKMTEQLHKETRIMDGMEIIQYSIMNAPKDLKNQETKDWLTLFQRAQFMTEEEVQSTIKTPAVLQAFERIKYDNLPSDVRAAFEKEDEEYNRISEYTKSEREEGEAKGRAEEKANAELEKAELLAKAELEKAELLAKAELEKAELLTKAKLEKISTTKEIAHNLYKQGVPISVIINTTNLSKEEIESP